MRYRKIICKYCGKEAVVTTLKKENYCDSVECTKAAHREKARISFRRNNCKEESNMETKKTEVVRTVSTNAVDNMKMSDINEITNTLGKVRHDIIVLLKEEQEKEQHLTKDRDILLHKAEFECETEEQQVQVVQLLSQYSKKRREHKYRIELLTALVDSTKMRNPNLFVKTAMTQAKNSRDFHGVIEKLKTDNNLYVVANNAR